MNTQLWKVRLVSFGYEALAFFLTGIIGSISSPEFSSIITKHFGETLTTSLALLLITGLVKHLRNLQIIKKFGAENGVDRFLI